MNKGVVLDQLKAQAASAKLFGSIALMNKEGRFIRPNAIPMTLGPYPWAKAQLKEAL